MATYSELFDLRNNTALLNRITSAVAVQANVIRQEDAGVSNHANRLVWAKRAFISPEAIAAEMLWGILATNAGVTSAQITDATDAAILSAVAALVDVYAS
jgi:hypothetical protein